MIQFLSVTSVGVRLLSTSDASKTAQDLFRVRQEMAEMKRSAVRSGSLYFQIVLIHLVSGQTPVLSGEASAYSNMFSTLMRVV